MSVDVSLSEPNVTISPAEKKYITTEYFSSDAWHSELTRTAIAQKETAALAAAIATTTQSGNSQI